MEKMFIVLTAASHRPNALSRRVLTWCVMVLALAFMITIPLRGVALADEIHFAIDDAATSAGILKVTVKWKQQGQVITENVNVGVKAGDTAKTIRDNITAALTTQSTLIKEAFTFVETSSKGDEFTRGTPVAGVVPLEASIGNLDKIGGISIVSGQTFAFNSPTDAVFFAVSGSAADADDMLSVALTNSADVDFTTPDIFTLSSYNGLSPNQIMLGLAELINANPNYTATFVDGQVFVFGNFNRDFGIDLIFSDTTTGTLAGVAGATTVPEPTTLLLFGSGLVAIIAVRKRHTATS